MRTITEIFMRLAYLLRIKRVKDWTLYPLVRKARAFELHKHEVHTLVLGSSHAQMGYLARAGEFNFGMGAQDLYYSYQLYRLYGQRARDIIIFYSVFSSGDRTIKSPYAYACVAYKVAFVIDWEDDGVAREGYFASMIWTYRRKMRRWLRRHPVDCNDLGNEESYCAFTADSAEARAESHLKRLHGDVNMGRFLERLVGDAKDRGQRVWMVIPPACKDYRKVVNAADDPFNCAWKVANKFANAAVLDYFNDEDFDDGDFIDYDHLGKAGAAKLTEKIRAAIARRSAHKR